MVYEEPLQIKPRWFGKFQASLPNLKGKVVVITGTTSGTGEVAARTCAELGAKVLCLNRPSDRSVSALNKLREQFPEADIGLIEADLMDFDSVKTAAKQVEEECEALDVLACNAGVMALKDEATKDGYDVQMQTNHLSHFLLVKELFPLLKKAAEINGEARIVNHSSAARYFPFTPLKAKYYKKRGGQLGGNGNSLILGGARWQRYHQSKLANAVFTKALARKLKAQSSRIKVLCCHPGGAATNLQVTTSKDGGMGVGCFGKTENMMRFSQSKEDGAMALLQCMVGKGVNSGETYGPRYLMVGPPKRVGLTMLATRKAENILWTESENAVGTFDPM